MSLLLLFDDVVVDDVVVAELILILLGIGAEDGVCRRLFEWLPVRADDSLCVLRIESWRLDLDDIELVVDCCCCCEGKRGGIIVPGGGVCSLLFDCFVGSMTSEDGFVATTSDVAPVVDEATREEVGFENSVLCFTVNVAFLMIRRALPVAWRHPVLGFCR